MLEFGLHEGAANAVFAETSGVEVVLVQDLTQETGGPPVPLFEFQDNDVGEGRGFTLAHELKVEVDRATLLKVSIGESDALEAIADHFGQAVGDAFDVLIKEPPFRWGQEGVQSSDFDPRFLCSAIARFALNLEESEIRLDVFAFPDL